jgi:hypothetical protein
MGGLIIFGVILGALFLFDLLALSRGTDSRAEFEIGSLSRGTDSRAEFEIGYTPARSRPI